MAGDKDLRDLDLTIDPFTGEPILSRAEMDALGGALQGSQQEQEAAREKAKTLRSEGWKTLAEASEILGLEPRNASLWRRAKALNDEGSPQVWNGKGRHPILVAPDQVASWLTASNQEHHCQQSADWMKLDEAAKMAGLNYMGAYKRAKKSDAAFQCFKQPMQHAVNALVSVGKGSRFP